MKKILCLCLTLSFFTMCSSDKTPIPDPPKPDNGFVHHQEYYKSPPEDFFDLSDKDYIFFGQEASYDALVATFFMVENQAKADHIYYVSRRDNYNNSYLKSKGFHQLDNFDELKSKISILVKAHPKSKMAYVGNDYWLSDLWDYAYPEGFDPQYSDVYFLSDGIISEDVLQNTTINDLEGFLDKVHLNTKKGNNKVSYMGNFARLIPGNEDSHYILWAKTLGDLYNSQAVIDKVASYPHTYERDFYTLFNEKMKTDAQKEDFFHMLISDTDSNSIDSIMSNKPDGKTVYFVATSHLSTEIMNNCLQDTINWYDSHAGKDLEYVLSVHPSSDWSPHDIKRDGKPYTVDKVPKGIPSELILAKYYEKIAFIGGYHSSVLMGFDNDKVKFLCRTATGDFKNDPLSANYYYNNVWNNTLQLDGSKGVKVFDMH